MRWQSDVDDLTVRRAAKARYAAIKAREDARTYREHLAMCEPDEPVWAVARAYATEQSGD